MSLALLQVPPCWTLNIITSQNGIQSCRGPTTQPTKQGTFAHTRNESTCGLIAPSLGIEAPKLCKEGSAIGNIQIQEVSKA